MNCQIPLCGWANSQLTKKVVLWLHQMKIEKRAISPKILYRNLLLTSVFMAISAAPAFAQTASSEAYLSWTASQAESVGKSMRESGQIGKSFDFRGIHTDRAINYKLRVTWITPDVIRAAARLEQLKNRLSDQQTRELVAEAEAAGDTVFKVEIDPREGSGVIPQDWRAILQPKDLSVGADGAVTGIKSPQFQNIKALAGASRRDYDYDVFWVAFPLVGKDKKPLFSDAVSHFQLVIGVYNSEGRVSWPVPESIRARTRSISTK